jgi:hypothetical protein
MTPARISPVIAAGMLISPTTSVESTRVSARIACACHGDLLEAETIHAHHHASSPADLLGFGMYPATNPG